MNTEYRFLAPLDVLNLRGNRLFDGAGAWGAALMPPWPSLAAGALRSRMLADGGVDLHAFGNDQAPADAALAAALGTPTQPGTFRISTFTLARRGADGSTEALFPLPADLVVTEAADTQAPHVTQLAIQALPPALACSAPLPQLPLLRSAAPNKPAGGYWLSGAGLAAYLAGRIPSSNQLLKQSTLWKIDARLGIALDANRRSAADGMLYTTDAIALCPDVGFLVGVDGTHGCLPGAGLVRLGGDGRAAALHPAAAMPAPDWQTITHSGRFRLLLATPALFTDGWRPDGIDADGIWQAPGFRARLVAACVGRAETVSGWDLAKGAPKPAERVAPVAAVYAFTDFDGPITALQALLAHGLPLADSARRAEGFNNVLIAAWPHDDADKE